MPAALGGKVNESLSKTFAFKGPDGLTDAGARSAPSIFFRPRVTSVLTRSATLCSERSAYDICRPLSCKHEACYKRLMYSQPKKQQEQCGPLMQEWKDCFARELQRLQGELAARRGT